MCIYKKKKVITHVYIYDLKMCNSYNRYNLNLYIYVCVIVIVFNCTVYIYIYMNYTLIS